MFKFIIILVAGVIVFLLTPIGQQFRAKAISIVNPAAAEQQVLGTIKQNLNSIANIINGPAGKNLNASQRANIENAIDGAEAALEDMEQKVEDSDLAVSINSLINRVIRRDTPVSATCPNP